MHLPYAAGKDQHPEEAEATRNIATTHPKVEDKVKDTEKKRKSNNEISPGVVTESKLHADTEDRANCIATATYYKAEAQGFMPGHELEDWLEVTSEFNARKGD